MGLPYIIKRKCLLYLFVFPVSLWGLAILLLYAVRTFEITEIIWWCDIVM